MVSTGGNDVACTGIVKTCTYEHTYHTDLGVVSVQRVPKSVGFNEIKQGNRLQRRNPGMSPEPFNIERSAN